MMEGPRGRATRGPLSDANSLPTAPRWQPIPPYETSGKPTKTPARPSIKPPQSSLNTAGSSDDLLPRAGSVMSVDNEGGQSVQVVVRVRPANAAELNTSNQSTCVELLGTRSLRLVRPGHTPSTYNFDHILGTTATQMEAFEVAGEPIVDSCLAGYNSSILAYGQTGSGKTFTMMGSLRSGTELCVNDQIGLAPRVFEYLYNQIAKEEEADENVRITCRCSYLEIYNEVVSDLLRPQSTGLQIELDGHGGYAAKGATEEAAVNASEVLTLMRRGTEQRHTAATRLNATSSRSHSVFTCLIERSCKSAENGVTKVIVSRLNLVDLAGSERISSGALGGSQASGQQFVETTCINQSLLTLGRIIEKLAKAQQKDVKVGHLEHRESRLTFLLKDSLGGNAKTTIIATVSASSVCAAETRSTLEFVRQAKHVRNRAVVNLNCRGDVGALQKEIQRLTVDLQHLRAGSTDPAIQECAELRRVLQEKQVEIDKLQRQVDEVTLEASHVKRERDRLEERLMGVQTEAATAQLASTAQLETVSAQLADSMQARAAADAQNQSLRGEVEVLQRERAAAVEAASLSAGRLLQSRFQLQLLQQEHIEVSQANGGLQAQVGTLAERAAQVKAQLDAERAVRAEREAALAASEAALAATQHKLTAVSANLEAHMTAAVGEITQEAKAPTSGIFSMRSGSKRARSEMYTHTVSLEAADTTASKIYRTAAPAGTARSSRPTTRAAARSLRLAAASLAKQVAVPESGEQAAAGDGAVEAPEEAVAGISSASHEAPLQQDEALSVHSSHATAPPKDHSKPSSVDQLVRQLQSSSVPDQETAAAALRGLSAWTVDMMIKVAGAIPSLVPLLGSSSADVQENAAALLTTLSVNTSNQVKVAAAGAIPLLVHLLDSSSAAVQQIAAQALSNLSCNADNHVKVAAAGAIPPLVQLLSSRTAVVQQWAVAALSNLSCNADNQVKIAAAGAIPPLVLLLSSSSAAAQEKAALALANLSCNNVNKVKIAYAGAIHPLVKMLGSNSTAVQNHVASALLRLSQNADNSSQVVDAGAIPALVLLQASSSAALRKIVARTLKCLSH